MFIHIGGDTVVSSADVIAILDVEAKSKAATKAFLEHQKQLGAIEIVDVAEVKSYVITNNRVYCSPISSLTLKKRAYLVEMSGRTDTE